MNTSKVLTVAIPTYNLGDYVGRLVEDIIAGENAELIEVLIVDDGSTDNTLEICAAIANEYPEIVRVLTKDNGHYGSAVNYAIEHANGAYFKIIDADDRVDSAGIGELVHALSGDSGIDLLMTDYSVEYYDGSIVKCRPEFNERSNGVIELKDLISLPMHAVTFRTSILTNNGIRLDTGVPYTDVEFVLFPLLYVKKIAYLRSVVYRYQIGRDGQSIDAKQMVSARRKHQAVLTSLIKWYLDNEAELETSGGIDFARLRIIQMYEKQVQVALDCDEPSKEAVELRNLKNIISNTSLASGFISCRIPFRFLIIGDFRLMNFAGWIYRNAKRVLK